MSSVQPSQLSYFGKIPSRGDFVKGAYNPQLLRALDGWLSQGMELLSEDPRWKMIYDSAVPVHFACLGSRSRLAIAGHLQTSRDEASRRFPFLVAVPFEVDAPIDFMVGAPSLLFPFWVMAESRVSEVLRAPEADAALLNLDAVPVAVDNRFRASSGQVAYDQFIRQTSLLRVEQMLNFDGHRVSLRRVMLALGLLLQPVAASAAVQLEKGLTLPLPREPALQPLVATFWMDVIAHFFAQADFEFVLCITLIDGRHRLVVGFNGLSAKTLQSVLHPQAYVDQNIDVDNAEWVEESIHSNYAMYKLVSYLEQPQLPLEIILGAFREVFLGK